MLNSDLKTAPSGEDIQRFLTSIIGKIEPKSQHAVPSYTTITTAIRYPVSTLVFEYADFSLSRHESSRIKALVDGFAKQGRLNREPTRERHWVGVTLVKLTIHALFKNALENGTRNWDVTIARALSLTLTSSLQC